MVILLENEAIDYTEFYLKIFPFSHIFHISKASTFITLKNMPAK